MKKSPVLKKLLIFAAVIASIFVIINVVWYVGIRMKYNRAIDRLNAAEDITTAEPMGTSSHAWVIDGHLFSIKDPGYLSNGGFIKCSSQEEYIVEMDEEGNSVSDNGEYITFYIWPELFGYQYGLDITDLDLWIMVYTDREGNYIPKNEENIEYNEEIEGILAQYEKVIEELIAVVNQYLELK